MSASTRPHEIARKTLRLLATRQIVPTPDNYRELYAEVAGNGAAELPAAERALRRLVADFPRATPELARIGDALTNAADARNWDGVRAGFTDFMQRREPSPSAWSSLLREFVRTTRETHHGLSASEKLAALDKALLAGGDLDALYQRLQTLAGAWAQLPVVLKSQPAAGEAPAHAAGDEDVRELRELLAKTLEMGVAARLFRHPELAHEATGIAQRLRAPTTPPAAAALRAQLQSLWVKIDLQGTRRNDLQEGLRQLLRLLVENVSELVVDDEWLRGQMAVVQQAIAGPLDSTALEEAKRHLTAVAFRQRLLRQSLSEAKGMLKQMVAAFIEQLGRLSESTGDYHDTMENLAQQIRQTEDMDRLKDLLEEVMRETRSVQASTLRAREEVLAARQQVDCAERRVRELETDLAQACLKAREDELTGALNRGGLHEAFERELASVAQNGNPLSIALLGIDNLHGLSETYGNRAGDGALAHLAGVIKEMLRPGDAVARFRGEEFLLLLPDSDARQAAEVMVRLQRELTRRYFLHDNNRLLVTFSAGVATHAPGESQAEAITRVEEALQRARRAGRNQVAAAE